MASRSRRRRTSVALAGVVAALGASACGGGIDHQYVANQRLGVYYRLPEAWETFDATPLAATQQGQLQPVWSMVFDGRDLPGANAIRDLQAAEPVGRSAVLLLPAAMRGAAARQTGLRRVLFGLATTSGDDGLVGSALLSQSGIPDPLTVAQQEPDRVEVLELDEGLVSESGYRGVRLVVKLSVDEAATRYTTVSQTGFLDGSSTLLYVLTVACESSCYEANQERIDDIVTSWTVEEAQA